jgi:hypothetical protein
MSVTYEPVDGCLAAEVGDATVVLVPNSSMEFVELDDIGTDIWEALASHRTTDAIATALADRYDVDLATLRADVAEYLEHLVERGMLRRGHD